MARRPRHNSRTYRSGLEDQVAAFLKEVQKEVRYEKLKIEWEDLRYRTYTPDFQLDNGILIETKGMFSMDDRRKHIAVKQQHPKLDIRFVFSNPLARCLGAPALGQEGSLSYPLKTSRVCCRGCKNE